MKGVLRNLLIILCMLPSLLVLQTHGQVIQEDLPDWIIRGHVKMPQVSKSVIDEMTALWPIIKPTNDEFNELPRPGELEGDKRVIELGNQAALAMVWLYVMDSPPTMILPTDSPETIQSKKQQRVDADGRNKEAILEGLLYDPVTIPWLLPILRARVVVFEDAVKSHQIENVFTHRELDLVNYYLDTHGTDQDATRADALNEKIREYYCSTNRPNARPPLAQRREEIDYNRQHAKKMASLTFVEGYAGKIRSFAEVNKLIVEEQEQNNELAHPARTAILAPVSVSSPNIAASAPMQTKATTQLQPVSLTKLVLIFIVIVTTAGASWLFLRRSK